MKTIILSFRKAKVLPVDRHDFSVVRVYYYYDYFGYDYYDCIMNLSRLSLHWAGHGIQSTSAAASATRYGSALPDMYCTLLISGARHSELLRAGRRPLLRGLLPPPLQPALCRLPGTGLTQNVGSEEISVDCSSL